MTLWGRSISFVSRTPSLESESASRRMSEAESGSTTRTQEMLALVLYWKLGEISFPNRSPFLGVKKIKIDSMFKRQLIEGRKT